MLRSRNLLYSKNLIKVQNISTIKEHNFLTSNTKVVFIKSRQVFTQKPVF